MKKLKIFLAAPISGFQDEKQYNSYREKVLQLINVLSVHCHINSEIQGISGIEVYDSPEASVEKDFTAIEEADVFIMLHPLQMQTSTLIELGYACAYKKPLIIVGAEKDLPYLIRGLTSPNYNVLSIYSSEITDETINQIIQALILLSKRLQ